MAFDTTNFGRASTHQNSTLPAEWTYTTTDAKTVVDTAGYFNGVVDFLKVGDVVKAKTSTGGTTEYVEFFVSSNDGTIVDVNDAVAYSTTTDTD